MLEDQFPETSPSIDYARHHYNFLEKLNLFISIYGKMAMGIIRVSWWYPFLLLAFFQALGLAGFAWFYVAPLTKIIYPILSIFLPEGIFHYPQFYLALPSIYSAYDNFILGPTIWLIILGWAVYRFGGFYSGKKLPFSNGLKSAFRAFPLLLIAWLIETGATLIILYLPIQILKPMIAGSPNRAVALSLALQMAALGVSAFLIYTAPGIIIGGRGIKSAIADSLALCYRNIFLTYFIVFIPSLIKIIFTFVLANFTPRIIALMNPDLVPGLLGIQIIFGIFINLFIYGTAVFIYKEFTGRA